ncbi:RHS repeat-associated core domain-containing protein [Sulfuriferula sp.]|uniref:RHS repeat-associated core domain-containing protein n=1 Tax=Sulfuriferula sp. TaxID=2025307 RepID=UPI002730ACBC|nr:RHS repeat-associated core domain-containing protein [Sulfuriferula sp.]MDP2027588.1 RHS repeat-associated core domain-containing protein [Sulfuriferula sp.]
MNRPDGGTLYFNLANGSWLPEADIPDTLTQLTNTSGTVTGWRYTAAADDSVELYNAGGQLQSITDRAGLTQTLAYDPNGHLISVTDATGRQLTFTYDTSNRMATMTDPAGGLYHYAYDASNNLSSVTYPDGKAKTYLYNEPANTSGANLPNALTGIVDENGNRYATYSYDTTGRAISTGHASGADLYTLAYTTNASGNPSTVVTDPLGTARTYSFQTILGVVKNTSLTQPCASCGGSSAATTYDANGNVASRTDFNGVVTTYSYDLTRNLETRRTEASGTPQARTISTVWDAAFRLPTQITEPGRVTRYVYDSHGNVTSQSTQDTATGTARTTTTAYTYASSVPGAMLSQVIDGPRTDVTDQTSIAYYDPAAACSGAAAGCRGQIQRVTNALGQVTSITSYDANGRPLSITDPNGLTTTLSYTPRGWLTRKTVGSQTTGYSYDNVGQLTQVSTPDGQRITYTYDAAHRLTDIQDGLGNRIHYSLDAMGNRTQQDTYDAIGTLSATHRRSFDALNRLYQDIGALNQTTTYSYGASGNLKTATDPLNHSTSYQYDALNRLTQTTDANLGNARYTYNPLDQLTQVADPRNLTTSYTVNALGDQTRLASPDTGTTNQTYDAAGNLASSTDARGVSAAYAYDALNRVTRIAYSGGLVIGFQYDAGPNALGKLTQMTDPSGITNWTYNAQGRVAGKTQVVNGVTQTLAYGYDAADRLASLTYPSGKVVSYGYTAQGQIMTLAVAGVPVVSGIQYQPFGPPKTWTWGNGAAYARSFDQDGRMTRYPLGANLRALSFDAAARITGITDTVPATANQVLGYDSLDRLTSWIAPYTYQSYAFDANGNRTGLTVGATQSTYRYPATSNRLAGISGGTTDNIGYDAAGNIQYQFNRKYTHDARGRLSAVNANGFNVSFGVNGLGQRVSKNGIDNSLYVYDEAGRLIGEYDKTGAPRQETLYLGDTPIAVIKAGQNYYVYADHLNTPRVITNTSNTPVWRWDSEPFGSDAANENPSGLGAFSYNLRFPGQYFDKETGLHYNYFRDYDPGTGRYVQSDPVGLAGGINTYAYAGGNPLGLIDPTGLDTAVAYGAATSSNPFGHVAIAMTNQGVYSFGTGNELGSSFTDYLALQAKYRNSLIYIIKTTPAQEQTMLSYLKSLNPRLPPVPSSDSNDTCAVRTNEAMRRVGMYDPRDPISSLIFGNSSPFPIDSAVSAKAYSSETVQIPKETTTFPSSFGAFNP